MYFFFFVSRSYSFAANNFSCVIVRTYSMFHNNSIPRVWGFRLHVPAEGDSTCNKMWGPTFELSLHNKQSRPFGFNLNTIIDGELRGCFGFDLGFGVDFAMLATRMNA
jgi:hypothetical protein